MTRDKQLHVRDDDFVDLVWVLNILKTEDSAVTAAVILDVTLAIVFTPRDSLQLRRHATQFDSVHSSCSESPTDSRSASPRCHISSDSLQLDSSEHSCCVASVGVGYDLQNAICHGRSCILLRLQFQNNSACN